MTWTCRPLSASAERSTSSSDRRRDSPRRSQLPATATVYRDANRQRPARLNHGNGRQFPLPAAKISNINAPLRQKQQQELRVNTGENFLVLTGWRNKTNQHAATPVRAAASFNKKKGTYFSTRRINSCTRRKVSLTIAIRAEFSRRSLLNPFSFWPSMV
jgi:hypothetical protein